MHSHVMRQKQFLENSHLYISYPLVTAVQTEDSDVDYRRVVVIYHC